MATVLGARSSTAPLPTGEMSRTDGYGGPGLLAWPPPANYFWMDVAATVPGQVGPFQRPERFWLCAYAWMLHRTESGWSNGVLQLQLVNGVGSIINDLTGRYAELAYITNEVYPAAYVTGAIECRFYCEANAVYYVQFVAAGGGVNSSYYSGTPDQMGLGGYTIGEGAY